MHPNEHLIGQPDSRRRLETPALMLDLDRLETNILQMQRLLENRGPKLRPHAKTHKSIRIARLQMEAGAIGICCATLGEAEALIAGGIEHVLITSPLVSTGKLDRLMQLAGQSDGLMVVVDHRGHVEALEAAAQRHNANVGVLVELDMGRARQGVGDPQAAENLARLVENCRHLTYRGVAAYAGQLQHVHEYAQRKQAALEVCQHLRNFVEHLRRAGLDPPIISGAGTGTVEIDSEDAIFTEIQAGSYVFMDRDYNAVTLGPQKNRFTSALFVMTTVISINARGYVTTDAGIKSFATDGPLPELIDGAPAGSDYRLYGDEHGRIVLPDDADQLPLGTRVTCVVPHCDPTVNLYDYYHCVRGNTLVEIWPIDARGRSL